MNIPKRNSIIHAQVCKSTMVLNELSPDPDEMNNSKI